MIGGNIDDVVRLQILKTTLKNYSLFGIVILRIIILDLGFIFDDFGTDHFLNIFNGFGISKDVGWMDDFPHFGI